METTRIDITKRYELINNRSAYLKAEIEAMSKELEAIGKEAEILKQLKELYASTPHDAIDEYRTQPPVRPQNAVKASGKSQLDSIMELLATGEVTRQEIIRELGYTGDQVAKAIFQLKKNGKVKETAPHTYARVNT